MMARFVNNARFQNFNTALSSNSYNIYFQQPHFAYLTVTGNIKFVSTGPITVSGGEHPLLYIDINITCDLNLVVKVFCLSKYGFENRHVTACNSNKPI